MREDPADAEIASHRLLLRSGFLHKSGAGLYLYGPLLQRTLTKVMAIIAEEIAATGALQVTMPILQEKELWEKSGRWRAYIESRTMLRVKDRSEAEFGLAPTAEEVVTDYAAHTVKSYKQLPVTFFQQHTKFRDEIRPRFGLMRVKEFIMMDAYSFHASEESLDQTYQDMHAAYTRSFQRLGLESFAVEADTGAIGGSASHEFMVAAEVGEDTVLICPDGGYAANVERAVRRATPTPTWSAPAQPAILPTPGARTIDEVVAYLRTHGYPDLSSQHLVKMVLFIAKTEQGFHTVAAGVPGDREVNEVKLTNALARHLGPHGPVLQLRAMSADEVRECTSAEPGFAGPAKGLSVAYCLLDSHLQHNGALVCGANLTEHHLVGFQVERDANINLLVGGHRLHARRGPVRPLRQAAGGAPRHRGRPCVQAGHQVLQGHGRAVPRPGSGPAPVPHGLLRHRLFARHRSRGRTAPRQRRHSLADGHRALPVRGGAGQGRRRPGRAGC